MDDSGSESLDIGETVVLVIVGGAREVNVCTGGARRPAFVVKVGGAR